MTKTQDMNAIVKRLQQPRHRPLADIAAEITRDWKEVNYAAKPYLAAMRQMNSITDMYGADPGVDIVLYFLSNAQTWHGEVARRVKKELNVMAKRPNRR